ncbi:geranylgeranyl reductase family protein [Corynebacterium vitaeruminis]|uniref:FAD-binding domain-containing protein n=1 Tax=Corynebacterium vitaeruminis DSM 20294 TaxID=1224164 RepID=W5XXN4_9CORY|nr:hypothetical protein B843_02045 [Corynebacterium vitaeruminis DSM 20294]
MEGVTFQAFDSPSYSSDPTRVDVLVVGAGPAGSAAALHCAARGLETLVVDTQSFPRDKTCGDGLTPRAMHQLRLLGLDGAITARYRSNGLKLHGYGGSVEVPWPDTEFGQVSSAMPRTELDHLLLQAAAARPEVSVWQGVGAASAEHSGARISAVTLTDGRVVRPGTVIVADGVRSTFGKTLGRTWHKGEVYGIAARSYCDTPRSREPWIHSHVELRDAQGEIQPGYGWIFPLGNGQANVGCGALSTDRRPARINTKKLLGQYAELTRPEWGFGQPQKVASALLPMGGAVSGVAGANWMLVGDAAACVNPLNGEGIDYALETARLAAELVDPRRDLTLVWPFVLRREYGEAFLLARTAARLLTYPAFLPAVGPLGLRGPLARVLMPAAARLMGNLVTDADRDLVARAWRGAGAVLHRVHPGAPLWS